MTTAKEVARRFLDNQNLHPLQIHNASRQARKLRQETTVHQESTYANTFRELRKEAARELMWEFSPEAQTRDDMVSLMARVRRQRHGGRKSYQYASFDFYDLFRCTVNDYWTPPESNMPVRKSKFYCGEDFVGVIPGYTRDQTWNGWECPYFERDQAKKVIEALNKQDGYRAEFIGDKIYVEHENMDHDVFAPKTIEFDGDKKTVWAIGAFSWTWSEHLVPIAFMGFKGSGKSEATTHLRHDYGHKVYAFAGKLKRACREIFGLDHDQLYDPDHKEKVDPFWGKTPREMMQLMGTEVGRAIDEDVWVKALMHELGDSGWLIEDCRFPNEAEAVREKGGIVVGIRRDKVVPEDSEDLHASEAEMLHNWDDMADVTIENNGTLEELYEKVEDVFKRAQEGRVG